MNRRLLVPVAVLFFSVAAGAEELPMSLPEDRELVQSVSPGFYHRGKGTPAEFITSGLGYYNEVIRAIHRLIPERMRRDYFRGAATLDDARETVRTFRENALRGFAWKEPRRRVTIPRVKNPADRWSGALVLRGEIPLDTPGTATGNALWMVSYDDQYLYLRAEVEDAGIQLNSKRPYEADSIEFFLRGSRRLTSYWEIVAAPEVPPFVGLHFFSRTLGLHVTQFDARPSALQITSGRTPGGFFAECAFPFAAFHRLDRPLPFSGGVLEFMFVRTDLQPGGVRKTAPVPLLYDGHNLFGYLIGVLE